jgi:iron complex outermembrane recepter protein
MAGRSFSVAAAMLVLTAALANSSAADAADTGAEAEAAAPADDGLAEVVVTAERRTESAARTPVSVSVLGSDALAKLAIVTESDLQTQVPGLTVKASSSSNQLNYSIRGQSLDAFSGVRPGVLPYFNEVQIAGAGSTAFYDLQSVQVLKGPQGTLFGRNATGGAVLFTTNRPTDELGGYISATGGNYNLFRAEGALNAPVVDDKLLTRTAFYYETHQGYQYNLYDNSHPGDVRRYGIRESLLIKPVAGVSNELVVDFAHSGGSSMSEVINSIYPAGSTNAPVPANFLFTPAVDSLLGPGAWASYLAAHPKADPAGIVAFTATQRTRGPYIIDIDSPTFHRANNWVVSNITTIDLANDLQLKNILGYTNLKSLDGAEFDGTPYDIDQRGTVGDDSRIRQVSDELQLLGKALDSKLDYVTGLFFSNEDHLERALSAVVDLGPLIPVTNQINDGDTKNKTYALYGQATYDLSGLGLEGLGVTAGGRYTSEKVSFLHEDDDVFIQNSHPGFVTPQSDTFKKFSWHAGLQEQLNPDWLVYATAQRSFRSGGFNFFSPPLPGLGNDGGGEYGPETATSVELGTKFQGRLADRPVRINADLYDMWVDDAQRVTYVAIFGAPAAVTVNVPKTRIRGLESDALFALTPWLNIGGSLNYTNAAFTENRVSILGATPVAFGPVPDVARWSGVAYTELTVPVRDTLQASLRAELYGQTSSTYSSTANTDNPGTGIPGYGLLNFRVGVEDSRAGWQLSGNLKNALNKVYYVGGVGFGSIFTYNDIVPGTPRTWQIELRYKF